jgi:adenylate cyclase
MTITLFKTIKMERSPESYILESLQRGSQIGSYSLLEPIGQGGEATVWSGWDDQEKRVVALKVVTLAATDASAATGVSNDFRRQVHLLASLEHPHILPLYEFGSTEEYFYFAMRYSSAGSLVNLLAKGPLPLDEVIRLSAQICRALEYIHKLGIVHRDLKPSNILLDWRQRAYLSDFGLAKEVLQETRPLHTGRGTGPYAPYEQHALLSAVPQSDIYSLGVLIYELLAGKLPWDGNESLALQQWRGLGELPDPSETNPAVPGELTEVLRQMTAFDWLHRPESASLALQWLADAVRGRTKIDVDELVQPIPNLSEAELLSQDAQPMLEWFMTGWRSEKDEFPARLTHLALINAAADQDAQFRQSLNDLQHQFLLRGALVYDYHLDYWWRQSGVMPFRQHACVDAIRNETDEPVVERALSRLLAESSPSGKLEAMVAAPVVERLVEIAASSQNWELRQEALVALDRLVPHKAGWRAIGISEQCDAKLAALVFDESSLAQQAARLVGKFHSLTAIQAIIQNSEDSKQEQVLTAMKEIRHSAGQLPRQVPAALRWRIGAWRLRDQILEDSGVISLPRLLIGFAAGALVVLMMVSRLFWQLSAQFRDILLEPQPLSNIVTIVAVDDASLVRYGRWDSWPRSLHAELIERLRQAGTKTIVFDFLFDAPTGADELLTQAMQRSGIVVLPVLCQGDAFLDQPGVVRFQECFQSQPALLAAAAATGHANVLHDSDGTVRRVPTVIEAGGIRVPGLALAGLQVFLGTGQPKSGGSGPAPVALLSENGIQNIMGRQIPVDSSGGMEIYYAGPPASPGKTTFRTISYMDVLDGRAPVDLLKDKIVLVGITATAEPDRYLTPVSRGRPMYGIEILANMIESIWSGRFIYHPGAFASSIILIGLGMLIGLLCVRPWIGILSAAGVALLYFLAASWLFDLSGYMLDLFYAWLAIGLSYVMVTAYRYSIETRQRRKVLQLLEKRVRPATMQAALRGVQKGTVSLEGRVQEVTLVIAVLRGYNQLASLYSPEVVLRATEQIWDTFLKCVLELDGTVAGQSGEQATIFFNAPLPQADHARLAVMSAVNARQALANDHSSLPAGHPHRIINLSFGVSTGKAIVGPAGSTGSQKYTVMGKPAYTAFQLAALGEAGQILIDEETYVKLGGSPPAIQSRSIPSPDGGERKIFYEVQPQ